MKPYPRSERIGAKIKTVLSEILQKKVQDPRIEIKGFQSSHGFIKKALASKLGLKFMPELRFVHDQSFDRGSRIDRLLKSVQSST